MQTSLLIMRISKLCRNISELTSALRDNDKNIAILYLWQASSPYGQGPIFLVTSHMLICCSK